MAMQTFASLAYATPPPLAFNPRDTHVTRAGENGLPYDVITQTFKSQALSMLPGQTIFTNPKNTPLTMPSVEVGGPYAILSFVGSMVDEANAQVPLDRVYTHHWIVEQPSHSNELCQNGLNYIFGIGAESRNSPAIFPDGHGYLIESEEVNKFGGNIHVLRTEDLSEHAVGMVPVGKAGAAGAAKQCNECYYALGKGKQCTLAQNGTFECCGDHCYDGSCGCPTKIGTKMIPVDFYLQYTMTYTRNVSMIKPLSVGVITTPNCEVFYNVLRNDDTPLTYSTTTFKNPADHTLYMAIGHQHTGARNVSLAINGKTFCTSYPTYGTEVGVAGNEKNHLVKMSTCYSYNASGTEPPLTIKKGSTISVNAWYYVGGDDPELGVDLGGTHMGVMSYMYLGYAAAPDALEEDLKLLQEKGWEIVEA